MKRMSFHAGIDIGGTKIAGTLLNANGRTLAFRDVPIRKTWKSGQLFDMTASLLSELCIRSHIPYERLKTIGIGIPGVVSDQGEILRVPNLPALERTPLRTLHPRASISLYNDASCAAYAEAMLGRLANVKSGIQLMLGTGLGGASVTTLGETRLLGQKTVTQITNIEIGHAVCSLNGYDDQRRQAFEFESFCSRQFFMQRSLDVHQLYQASLAGQTSAQAVFHEFGMNVSALLVTIDTIFRPEVIIFGGGLTAYWNAFGPIALETFRNKRFLPTPPPNIHRSAFGEEIGAIGAALYGMMRDTK